MYFNVVTDMNKSGIKKMKKLDCKLWKTEEDDVILEVISHKNPVLN